MDQKNFEKMASNTYTESFKRKMIEYYLANEYTKKHVWQKFTGYIEEHGTLLRWMRELGYLDQVGANMKTKKVCQNELDQKVESERIRELEQRLKDAELKVIAYSKMIEIAEEEFEISIRKKYNTKL